MIAMSRRSEDRSGRTSHAGALAGAGLAGVAVLLTLVALAVGVATRPGDPCSDASSWQSFALHLAAVGAPLGLVAAIANAILCSSADGREKTITGVAAWAGAVAIALGVLAFLATFQLCLEF